MSNNFPITEAQLVGLFMECIAYGIFLVTFGMCAKVLLCGRDQLVLKRARDINWGMLAVAMLMFIFATFDVAFGLRHNLEAFIFAKGADGAEVEFGIMNNWVNIMKTVDFVGQTAVGDAILIYRCYMVYSQRWTIVLLPILIWLTALVSGILMMWVEATTSKDALLNDHRITPWLDTITACTLVLNVLVTSLIVWRIWRVKSQAASATVHPHRLTRIMRIILDSGLIYTFCVIVFFGTTLAGSNAQYGVSDVVVQVIGITFNLIILRVNNGSAPENNFTSTIELPRTGPSYGLQFAHTAHTASLDPHAFSTPAEINVSMQVTRHGDGDSVFTTDRSWKADGLAV